MTVKQTKSQLLEQLRAQADTIAARRVKQEQLSREVVDHVDRRLHAVFRYFDEACKLLEIVAPRIEREFALPHIVRYEGMTYERGLVMTRKQQIQNRDVYDYVVVYYSLIGPPPTPIQVSIRRASEVERLLNAYNVEFTSSSDSNIRGAAAHNVIHVAPGLRCEVRFDPDFINDRVVVTLRNVDRFEPVVLDFEPDALDDAALDDLVNLMLGKPSQFLLRAPLRGFGR